MARPSVQPNGEQAVTLAAGEGDSGRQCGECKEHRAALAAEASSPYQEAVAGFPRRQFLLKGLALVALGFASQFLPPIGLFSRATPAEANCPTCGDLYYCRSTFSGTRCGFIYPCCGCPNCCYARYWYYDRWSYPLVAPCNCNVYCGRFYTIYCNDCNHCGFPCG